MSNSDLAQGNAIPMNVRLPVDIVSSFNRFHELYIEYCVATNHPRPSRTDSLIRLLRVGIATDLPTVMCGAKGSEK